jgi:hypothetical protein
MLQLSHFERLCEFVDRLDRPDVHDVDASRGPGETYERVKQIVSRSAAGDFAESD